MLFFYTYFYALIIYLLTRCSADPLGLHCTEILQDYDNVRQGYAKNQKAQGGCTSIHALTQDQKAKGDRTSILKLRNEQKKHGGRITGDKKRKAFFLECPTQNG